MRADRVKGPSFDFRQLPGRLRANATNRLTYYGAEGAKRVRAFPEVYDDARRAAARLRAAGLPLGEGRRAVVAGATGYEWLLGALACLFAGVEVVALPETLEEGDAALSLAGLSLDFALTDGRMAGYGAFAGLPRARLEGLADGGGEALGPDFDECPGAGLVAFTSGSTSGAKLKCFRVDLASTAAFADAFTSSFGLGHDDQWVVCHTFTHIVHFEYVLGALGWGYDVTLCDPMRLVLNGAALRPSVVVSVPSVYEQLAAQIRRRLPKSGPRAEELSRLLEPGGPPPSADPPPPLLPEAAAVLGDRLKVMIIGAAPSSAELRRFLRLSGLPVYEGYGMSELNMVACNVPGHFRHGTVGRAWPGVDVALDDEGVVLARCHVPRSGAYLNVPPEEGALTFLEGGWVNTGDLGRLDGGYLTIVGRKKEIIVSDGAKKINVAAVEARLREVPGVGQALVFGDARPYLVAVFAPAPGEPLPPAEELRRRLGPINAGLERHERVLDFVCSAEPFTAENGLLTRSGKPRRQAVGEHFAGAIANLYGPAGPRP